jgi:hypothetical protein
MGDSQMTPCVLISTVNHNLAGNLQHQGQYAPAEVSLQRKSAFRGNWVAKPLRVGTLTCWSRPGHGALLAPC